MNSSSNKEVITADHPIEKKRFYGINRITLGLCLIFLLCGFSLIKDQKSIIGFVQINESDTKNDVINQFSTNSIITTTTTLQYENEIDNEISQDMIESTQQKQKEQQQEQQKQQEQQQNVVREEEEIINKKQEETEMNDIPEKKLNIVLLYADDWSFNMIGAMGNDYIKTPNLDQLAKEGILFTHNCVVASVCMQSRATLYTGQYSSRHKTYKSYADIVMYEPNNWRNTLYPLMMNENYHVGFFGKYHHLEPPPEDIPTFSIFQSSPFSHYFKRNEIEKHVTQWNEEDGLRFLDDRPTDQPFFLTVSFFATHAEDGSPEQYRPMNTSMHLYADEPVPLPKTYTDKHWKEMPYFFDDNNEARSRFRSRYNTPEDYQHHMKNTCRMVTEVDTACGNIIKKLKEQGIYDNTLIIFTTDNGNTHGQHGLSEKWYAYEESLRVPLIIKDPRMSTEVIGTKNDEFTLNIDLAPTILSAVGAVPPNVMQGQDISQLYLQPTPTWRKEFLYEFHDGNPVIMNSLALVTKDSKYIYWEDQNYTQFFDLKNDPYEEFDLHNITDEIQLRILKDRMDVLNALILTDHKF